MRNADDIGGLRQTKRWPDGNYDFILLRAGFGFADFRQELSPDTGATATGAAEATEAAGALKETGLSAPDFISDSTSSIIWRSSVSLISIFHPLAKFIGIERARDIFNLFPALALQAVACCRTGIIVHVIHG